MKIHFGVSYIQPCKHEHRKNKSWYYGNISTGKRDFWSVSAVAYLSAFILYVKEKYKEKVNMRHIVEMVANKYPRVLATCRGLGMTMMTIIQDIGQLEDKRRYGPVMARSIINWYPGFCELKIPKRRNILVSLPEKQTVKHKQKSASYGRKDGSKSISEQYVKR